MSRRTGSRPAWLALGAIVALAASPGDAPADVSAVATVDRNPAVEGEALTFTITVSGALTGAAEPELPGELRARFDVFSSGTSRQMTFANGVTQSSISYRYEIVPRSSGTLTIPAIPVDVGGRTIRTEPIDLVVEPRGSHPARSPRSGSGGSSDDPSTEAPTDALRLVAAVDKRRVVEGEEIVLTISFLHRVRLIDRPEFEPPTTTGFVTERLPDGPMREEIHDGVPYNVQELRYALFPLGRGEKTIGAARVAASVPRRGRRDAFSVFGSWFDGREVTVTSEPITIQVDPLPPTDDPAFSGAVGTFSLKASIDTDDVVQNDPVTLSIRISGVGNLGSAGEIRAPETDRFRVFDAASDMEPKVIGDRLGGVRTIQRAFVPLEAGDQEIPEVRFTYYDPAARAYRTHTAGPFPIHVREAGTSSGAPLIVGKNEVQRLDEDVRYIRTSLGALRRTGGPVRSVGVAVHLLPLALVGGAAAWRRRRDRLESDAAYMRARGAMGRARRRLAEADSQPNGGASAWSAIGTYLADRLDTSEVVLTATEAAGRLEPIDPALAARVRAFGERCDFARFAPASARSGLEEIVTEARGLLDDLESSPLRRRGGRS